MNILFKSGQDKAANNGGWAPPFYSPTIPWPLLLLLFRFLLQCFPGGSAALDYSKPLLFIPAEESAIWAQEKVPFVYYYIVIAHKLT